jgi:hypothetical protein
MVGDSATASISSQLAARHVAAPAMRAGEEINATATRECLLPSCRERKEFDAATPR